MRHASRSCRLIASVTLLTLSLLISRAPAHETDQHPLPLDRQFVDLGPHITNMTCGAIERGVAKVNARIDTWTRVGDAKTLKQVKSDDEVAAAVNREFPFAVFLIEGLDKKG